MRGFKIANAAIGQPLREAREKVERLREELRVMVNLMWREPDRGASRLV
jgi:hypothetical protein